LFQRALGLGTECRAPGHYDMAAADEAGEGSGRRQAGRLSQCDAYPFEEVVASISQCLICEELGLPGGAHGNYASCTNHCVDSVKGATSTTIYAVTKAKQAFANSKFLAVQVMAVRRLDQDRCRRYTQVGDMNAAYIDNVLAVAEPRRA